MRTSEQIPHLVSVVIPCSNAEPFIRDTIESILCQTRPVDEVIVVDDGSGDDSAGVAESFGPPVRVIRQSRGGVSAARNRGIQEAKGDLIAFLDADDLWSPQKIERQLAYLDAHPDVDVVTSNAADFRGPTIVRFSRFSDDFFRKLQPIDFLTSYYLNQSASMVRAPLVRVVPYPEGEAYNEDMVHTTILRTRTEIGRVQETLVYIRRHPGQATESANGFLRGASFRIKWAKENYRLIGFESETAAVSPVLKTAVDWVMTPYWSRDLQEFKRRRSALLEICPLEDPVLHELNRVLAPRFVLIFWDELRKVMRSGQNR